MEFIKELYYGNISNEAQKIAPGSEYQKLSSSCLSLYEELRHNLDEADIRKLDRLCLTEYNIVADKSVTVMLYKMLDK